MNRKITFIICMAVCVFMLVGCSGKAETEWEKTAKLDAEETSEELYEAAKGEGVLSIYTVSSRLFDVAESFQKQYPGLLVDVCYYRAEEMVEKVKENQKNGTNDCDLLFVTNGDGCITEDLIPNKLAYKYVPYDIEDSMRTGGSEEYVSVLLEVPLLTYNDDYYTNAPVSNWWELTEEKWRGKLYITNPTKSMISYTLFSMFMKNSDEMETAYEEYFGKKYEATGNESAGEAFVRMLVENDINVVNDSDDVANAVAAPGIKSDAVGILNASKLRMRDQGYALQVCYDLKPFAGVINPANIMIAGDAKNINSAKLFVRWILGETDGQGDGYKPFLQEGAWPSRVDVEGGATRKLDDMNVVYTDETYSSKNRDAFLNFWNQLNN